jgi:DNA-directed RNA polymerase subunit beta'
LGDIRIPDQKPNLIADAREQVEGISLNPCMGLITITNVKPSYYCCMTSANAITN